VTQTNAIVIRIRKEQTAEFERLFEAEELPIWDDFAAQGVLLRGSLTRVGFGSEESEDYRCYVIIAEFPGMAGHSAHDADPRFNAFLEKARRLQPEAPSVWGGRTLWSRPDRARRTPGTTGAKSQARTSSKRRTRSAPPAKRRAGASSAPGKPRAGAASAPPKRRTR
jgi:hypothetical protein